MSKDMQFLVECLSEDVIAMLMDKYRYSLEQAADVFYNSHTYALLEDERSGLYYQGSLYVFDTLLQEIERTK